MSDTYALTIRQPYATLVMMGAKRYETRKWPAPRGLVGERIAIHAGLAKEQLKLTPDEPFKSTLGAREIPLGYVLGTVRLAACITLDTDFIEALDPHERAFGAYYTPGNYAWLLEDVRLLHVPKQWKGAQGFWRLPSDVVELSPVNPGQGSLL